MATTTKASGNDRTATARDPNAGPAVPRLSVAERIEAYADQNERDYLTLEAAVDSGRVDAQTGL